MKNVWNKESYKRFWRSHEIFYIVKQFFRDIKYSLQRITKGYCDKDLWDISDWFLKLMPDMLTEYKKTRHGSPGILGKNYKNEKELLVNDECHHEWDRILSKMIFLFREADEDTCRKKNPYEKAYMEAFDTFSKKYGVMGEKLRTPEEIKRNKKEHVITYHSMEELDEYKEICENYRKCEKELSEYRLKCKDKAFELFSKWFYHLWD